MTGNRIFSATKVATNPRERPKADFMAADHVFAGHVADQPAQTRGKNTAERPSIFSGKNLKENVIAGTDFKTKSFSEYVVDAKKEPNKIRTRVVKISAMFTLCAGLVGATLFTQIPVETRSLYVAQTIQMLKGNSSPLVRVVDTDKQFVAFVPRNKLEDFKRDWTKYQNSQTQNEASNISEHAGAAKSTKAAHSSAPSVSSVEDAGDESVNKASGFSISTAIVNAVSKIGRGQVATGGEEYLAKGCGQQRGFDDFWVSGLDKTPIVTDFIAAYKARMQMPRSMSNRSDWGNKRKFQLLLGLNECYPEIKDSTYDGSFGPVTQEAIKKFQKQNDLPQTGIADENMMNHLMHASAMRVLYNMHVLEVTAVRHGVAAQGLFQKTWHESGYNHMAASGTGANGIGQMIGRTFLGEMKKGGHSFWAKYKRDKARGGRHEKAVKAELREYQFDVWAGADMMARHCKSLMRSFRQSNCAKVYGSYQLGMGGYADLKRAAKQRPRVQAASVVRGTKTNGYGHLSAREAFKHVNNIVDSKTDRAMAVSDLKYLKAIRAQRDNILGRNHNRSSYAYHQPKA